MAALQVHAEIAEDAASREVVISTLDAGMPPDLAGDSSLLGDLQELAQRFAAPLDPQALFDSVVRLAAALTGAETATLLLDAPEGRGLVVQAEWGQPQGPRPRCYLGRWGVAGRVITRGEMVLIDHAPSDPRYAAPAFGPPSRSLLGVPLRRGTSVIGALHVAHHSRSFAFGERDMDVLQMLAQFAAVGLEVADLLLERDDRAGRLEQQNQILTALYDQVSRTAREQSALYGISRSIQSAPDIEATFPNVLAVLAELIRADRAQIFLVPNLEPLAPASPANQVAQWARPDAGPADSWQATLPLRRGDHDLGRIVLARGPAGGPFDAHDLALAGAVVDQLSLALENRSLLVRDLTTLSEAPGGKHAPLDLTQLIVRLLTQAQMLAALSGAAALLYDADTDDWQVVAEVGVLPAYWPLPPFRRRDLLDQVRRTHAPVRHVPAAAPSGSLLLLVPMLAEDRLIGAFVLPAPPGHGLPARLPFLGALAGRAAVLIHNMQLQLRAEELVIMEERNRIAREMHDGLAQTLTQIRMRCEYIERIVRSDPDRALAELDLMRLELRSSTGELVRVIHALAPPPLDDQGLSRALQELGEAFAMPGRLQVEVTVPDDAVDLPPQLELTLFRVAQEWLRAVAWHLGVTICRVVLAATADSAALTIEDNGTVSTTGLESDIGGAPERTRSLPLVRARVAELGGMLDITVSAESGTRLVVTLPLRPAQAG